VKKNSGLTNFMIMIFPNYIFGCQQQL